MEINSEKLLLGFLAQSGNGAEITWEEDKGGEGINPRAIGAVETLRYLGLITGYEERKINDFVSSLLLEMSDDQLAKLKALIKV